MERGFFTSATGRLREQRVSSPRWRAAHPAPPLPSGTPPRASRWRAPATTAASAAESAAQVTEHPDHHAAEREYPEERQRYLEERGHPVAPARASSNVRSERTSTGAVNNKAEHTPTSTKALTRVDRGRSGLRADLKLGR